MLPGKAQVKQRDIGSSYMGKTGWGGRNTGTDSHRSGQAKFLNCRDYSGKFTATFAIRSKGDAHAYSKKTDKK